MRKKDEMEHEIANKSMKISWFITVAVLFILGIIQGINDGESYNIFFLLAGGSVSLYIILERYYLAKVDENRSFPNFIILVVILIVIMLAIGWWFGR